MMIVVGSAKAICGRMIPQWVFIRPRSRIMMYSGVIATVMREHQPGGEERVHRRRGRVNSYRAIT